MVNTHVPVSYSHRTTQYAQQRLVRDLCDLTDALFSFRTTWNRLWASIHLLHQNRENTLKPARSISWLAQPTLVHLLKSGTHHLAELVTHFLAPVHINMLKAQCVMSGNFTNTLHGAWWAPNLPIYNMTASIWVEHNPNSTNPWCSSHTHPFSTNSVLHLSCKNSQENMSASPCSSNVMFFHLLMLLCACTNLNVMIEIFLKTLSFSEHLKQTALVRPPSTSWTTSKRNCVILNWTCWSPQPSTSHKNFLQNRIPSSWPATTPQLR